MPCFFDAKCRGRPPGCIFRNVYTIFAYQTVGMKDTKEHILITSLGLFLQKSFKEVTLKEIVDRTGLSKGAFYHYFSSKEQVFADVIYYFFSDSMIGDYSQFPQQSLKSFYNAILDRYKKNTASMHQLIPGQNDDTLSSNYYYLLFDALKMLPDFKEKYQAEHKNELKAWQYVIGLAKNNFEIKTAISNEQLAKSFIYLGDGAYINLVIEGGVSKSTAGLKQLWDGLYDILKV
jgi:TetR/AcrR family transcriptional repressor of nem operon